MELKSCSKCGEHKPLGAFHRRRASKDGRSYICKECTKPIRAQQFQATKAHRKEQGRAWRIANRERARLYDRRWRQANLERARKLSARNARAWQRRNPAKVRQIIAVRRARQKQATIGDTAKISAYYEYVATARRLRCYYCNKITPKRKRHVDHKIALARGGKHCVENLCCSCAPCNMKKHMLSDEEFTGQLNLFR